MDEWTLFELLEIVSGLIYLAFFARRYEDTLTRRWFALIVVVLTYDVLVLHRVRPDWMKIPLNVPTGIYCYEKLWKQGVFIYGKKLAAGVLLLLR
jgi:uncharacterized membrane protein YoaT (DUF817 family)